MDEKYELVTDLQRSLGVCNLTIPTGTRLVSHDGGNTYRFKGLSAITVLTAQEITELLRLGTLREVS